MLGIPVNARTTSLEITGIIELDFVVFAFGYR